MKGLKIKGTILPDHTGKNIKLRYGSGESGWAHDLDNGTAFIANIPLEDDLNIDDLVEHNGTRVTKVLYRMFLGKTRVDYPAPHDANYAKLWDALHARGCKIEWMVPGMAIVAHSPKLDVKAIVEEALTR